MREQSHTKQLGMQELGMGQLVKVNHEVRHRRPLILPFSRAETLVQNDTAGGNPE